MSQEDSNSIPPETQQQRWLKYGGNVLLASVVVIALAVLLIWVSERKGVKRWDTTAAGLYSLKPQTIAIIKPNTQPITIISLFTKAKQTGTDVDASAEETSGVAPIDKPAIVSDLLDEYRSQGSNIKTEVIDPDLNPGKAEDLLKEVMKQYGGEVDNYQKFTDSIPTKYASLIKSLTEESDKINAALKQSQGADMDQWIQLAVFSIEQLPSLLKEQQDGYSDDLKLKVPDYKKVTDEVSSNMQRLSKKLDGIQEIFKRDKDDKSTPQPLRDYMVSSDSRYALIKKQADDMVAAVKGLGELKLDTLRDALKQKNCILVRGSKEWRLIPYEKIWKTDARRGGGGAARPTFAGEQMVTTAILSLNQTAKLKVCFMRAGGPPVTETGGSFNSIATRLRDYNFDVSEKDSSGTWAMQAMQRQMPAPPEPSDADVDDAVWVVDGQQMQENPMMGGPPPEFGAKLAQHLQSGHHWVDGKRLDGGSAFVMFPPQHADAMTAALTPWGITAHTNAMAVHPKVPYEGAADGGVINAAQHEPMIFTITQWGDHPITNPLQSLMGLLLEAVPIEVTKVDGINATAILPVPGAPNAPPSWGETDQVSIQSDAGPKYDKDADLKAPIYAGAAAENKSGARLVCLGSEASLIGAAGSLNQNLVDYPDADLLQNKHIYAPQFPGSAEFFMNSCFWLSHQETMIAISPAAMNISRIGDIKPATLRFWHIGVLLIGLPGLVIAAGAFAYYSRQE